VDLWLSFSSGCQFQRPDRSLGDGGDQVIVSSREEVHTVRCAHRFQCFDSGSGVGRGGATGDAARVQGVAADTKFTEGQRIPSSLKGAIENIEYKGGGQRAKDGDIGVYRGTDGFRGDRGP
jgi:hypothetical protein